MPTDDNADDGLVKEFNATAHKLVRLTIAMMEGPDGRSPPTRSSRCWRVPRRAARLGEQPVGVHRRHDRPVHPVPD